MNPKSIPKDSTTENTLLLDTVRQVMLELDIILTSKPTPVLLQILACPLIILKSETIVTGNKRLLMLTKMFY